jgi:hypothetical protein
MFLLKVKTISIFAVATPFMESQEDSPKKLEFCSSSSIPDNHWSMHCKKEWKVAVLKVDDNLVLIQLNPTDSRGYRLITQLYSSNDMKSTFNRQWTTTEMISVFKVGALLSTFFFENELFPQVYFAGNNSMEVENGMVLLGRKEPSMMHIHVLGRGVPGREYIKGAPYIAPEVGEEFNLKGDGHELGKKKMPWTQNQRDTFKAALFKFLKENSPYELVDGL